MYRSASTTDERKAATSLLLKEIDLCEDEFMIDPVAASYLREKVSPRNLCEFSKNDFDTYDVEPRLFFGGLAGNKIALSLPYFMFYTSFSNLVVKYPNDLREKGVKNCSLFLITLVSNTGSVGYWPTTNGPGTPPTGPYWSVFRWIC